MDTEPWPPHQGTQEHYLVKDDVWAAAGMPPGKTTDDLAMHGGGILCIACIERRLGRLLTKDDFEPITHNLLKGCQNTPRLLSRVGIAFMAVANAPLPEHIVKRWAEAVLTKALKDAPQGRDLLRVEIDTETDEVLLLYQKRARPRNDDDPEGIRYRAGPGIKAFIASLRRDNPTPGQIDLTCVG